MFKSTKIGKCALNIIAKLVIKEILIQTGFTRKYISKNILKIHSKQVLVNLFEPSYFE